MLKRPRFPTTGGSNRTRRSQRCQEYGGISHNLWTGDFRNSNYGNQISQRVWNGSKKIRNRPVSVGRLFIKNHEWYTLLYPIQTPLHSFTHSGPGVIYTSIGPFFYFLWFLCSVTYSRDVFLMFSATHIYSHQTQLLFWGTRPLPWKTSYDTFTLVRVVVSTRLWSSFSFFEKPKTKNKILSFLFLSF